MNWQLNLIIMSGNFYINIDKMICRGKKQNEVCFGSKIIPKMASRFYLWFKIFKIKPPLVNPFELIFRNECNINGLDIKDSNWLDQGCLLWRDIAKSHRNITSPSQRCVASSWRIATLLLQWGKLVTVNVFYNHLASNTSDADDDLHDTYTKHVIFSF
jgi:hypothetical protein